MRHRETKGRWPMMKGSEVKPKDSEVTSIGSEVLTYENNDGTQGALVEVQPKVG